MSRSMYSVMPTVIDTIIPFSSSPLPVSYNSNSSSSWEDHPGPESLQSDEEHEQASIETSRSSISMMSTSVMGSLMEDDNEDNQTWTDFNVDDPPTPVDPVTNPQIFQSLYEGSARQSRSYHLPIMLSQRPIRGLRSIRSHSMSPARQQRIENVISAICVLMDDLDQNGLRTVIEQAQQRIKKQH
uniref:Uncharacterized protein n=1 Tax=Acrobeloides nanus TaxID=290746 RepID=A0A914DCE7_9BILA